MSIIHEALKKAQANLEQTGQKKSTNIIPPIPGSAPTNTPGSSQTQSKKNESSRLVMLIFTLIIVATITVIYYFFMNNNQAQKTIASIKTVLKPQKPETINKPTAQPFTVTSEAQPSVKLKLEGTMMMGDKRVALINGEVYQIGETINGMEILNINIEKVVLKDGENIITIGSKE